MQLPDMNLLVALDALLELEYALIPHGLHVVGQTLSDDERADMLASMPSMFARPTLDAIPLLQSSRPVTDNPVPGGRSPRSFCKKAA